MFPIDDILPEYSLLDSGINSPDTTYSIAPAANAKQNAITSPDISPIIAPINAPTPVAIPEKNTHPIIVNLFTPPVFIGTAIEIPSGTSCMAIATASENPSLNDASKPAPIANPSGLG